MTKKERKIMAETLENIRNSQEKEVNLIPFSPESFKDIISKNVNQLWRWDTLEDVKL